MGKKRTLADDLAELATAAPAAEPSVDEADLGDEAKLLDSDYEEAAPRKRSRLAPEKALRLRADISGAEEDSQGVTISRAEAFGFSDAESLETSEEESDREFGSDSGSQLGSDPKDGEANASEPSSDPGEEDETVRAELNGPNGLPQEHEPSIQAEEAAQISVLQHMKDTIAKESAKGAATRNQQALWDKLLEMRILLQKSLAASQRLPITKDLEAVKGSSEKWTAAIDAMSQEITACVADLLALEQAMIEHGPVLTDGMNASIMPSGLDELATAGELWPAVDHSYSSIADFRNTSLDRWYRKSLLGGGVTLKSNLQSLNQSVSVQVLNLMKGSDRLIRKTQPDMRFMPKRLCSYQQASSESEAVGIADPETFDDSEFYQQLLKEFLEASSIVGSAVPASTKKRVKPPRDRKGSKGRRLRYDVQEKLVNFMAPKKYEEPAIAGQLFRNLFAHKR